jgi:hypothetical protein
MGDPPPLILLADFVRALRALGVSDVATRRAIARLLGLELAEAVAETPAAHDEKSSAQPPIPLEHEPPDDFRPGLADLVAPAPQTRPRPVAFRLERLAGNGDEAPPWVTDVEPLEEAPAERVQREPEPLLVPRWTPAVVAEVAATAASDGQIDAGRTVSLLAAGRPLLDLPRRPIPTVRRGAQVLVDIGYGMLPFAADERQLLASLRVVLGFERVQVLHFEGLPTRGAGTGSRATWRAYEPPARGKPVIVVSDLGTAPPRLEDDSATSEEWLAFAETIRRAGCPLVAFVPYPRRRLPLAVVRAFRVVEWDRTTTATTVRSMIGPLPALA